MRYLSSEGYRKILYLQSTLLCLLLSLSTVYLQQHGLCWYNEQNWVLGRHLIVWYFFGDLLKSQWYFLLVVNLSSVQQAIDLKMSTIEFSDVTAKVNIFSKTNIKISWVWDAVGCPPRRHQQKALISKVLTLNVICVRIPTSQQYTCCMKSI